MCMQDWRVARLIKPGQVYNLIPSGSVIIPRNQQRVGLVVGALSNNAAEFPVWKAVFESGASFGISAGGTSSKVMSTTEFGALIQSSVSFFSFTVSFTIDITELLMPEEYLAAGLEQFVSEYARWKQ